MVKLTKTLITDLKITCIHIPYNRLILTDNCPQKSAHAHAHTHTHTHTHTQKTDNNNKIHFTN